MDLGNCWLIRFMSVPDQLAEITMIKSINKLVLIISMVSAKVNSASMYFENIHRYMSRSIAVTSGMQIGMPGATPGQ